MEYKINKLKDNFKGLIFMQVNGEICSVYEAIEMTYPEKVYITEFSDCDNIDVVNEKIYNHFFN